MQEKEIHVVLAEVAERREQEDRERRESAAALEGIRRNQAAKYATEEAVKAARAVERARVSDLLRDPVTEARFIVAIRELLGGSRPRGCG